MCRTNSRRIEFNVRLIWWKRHELWPDFTYEFQSLIFLKKQVFILQMKTVRIVMGVKPRNCCRVLFNRLQILTLPSEYICIYFFSTNRLHYK
jgi:hypothetical protein